jgi:hypothetical protein
MASAEEAAPTGSSGGLGRPLLIAATFAAGAGAALAVKSVLDSRRRKAGSVPAAPGAEPEQDLATTLRLAALDVAIAATNEAAERLSVEEQGREPAEQR